MAGSVLCFPQRVVLVFRRKVEAEGCFSFSELPRHVGALTCHASWVINPSRWMHHRLAHVQREVLEKCY